MKDTNYAAFTKVYCMENFKLKTGNYGETFIAQTQNTAEFNYSLLQEKKNEICLSPMTKVNIPPENSTTNSRHKNASKISITQRLPTDLGRSVGVATVIHLVLISFLIIIIWLVN